MGKPRTDGPRELIQHAVDHLGAGGDFDRRIAMISVDNAVELMVRVYLGLPKRARGGSGPSRRELEAAQDSFADLLGLLETHAGDRLQGIGLDDIEWYHRLRNQLYHSGNGITVERAKVETYVALASGLFHGLFDEELLLSGGAVRRTSVGEFLELWVELERLSRSVAARRLGVAEKSVANHHWTMSLELALQEPQLANAYQEVRRFRNDLVHGLATPEPIVISTQIERVRELIAAVTRLAEGGSAGS